MIIDINDTAYPNAKEKVKELLADKDRYAHVITFGCQQNEADSEKIKRIVIDMGYILTGDASCADLIIINTCAIRAHAEEKAFSLLGRFKAQKKHNPELIIGVCGCMAAEKSAQDKLKNDFHFVTFTLAPALIHTIPEQILKYLTSRKRSFIFDKEAPDITEGITSVRSAKHKAWVSVMYGCNNFCSYCIVPYVRGRERSRKSEDILAECRALVADGVKEITLLGQNVNSYASDLTFPQLLEKIAQIDGDFIIRFMTSHPKDVSDALICVIRRFTGKIAPYFHLPLQSGSDKILRLMNRTYNREKFLETVEKLRSSVPNIAISTDIIIGFPGENDTDFLDTVQMLSEVRFDMAYIFNYSEREGTRAAKMDGKVDTDAKDKRMNELLTVQGEISYEKNQPYVGKTVRVLVDSVSKRGEENTYTARTDTNKLVHFISDRDCIGEFVYLKIIKAGAFDLFGEEIKEKQND